MITMIIGLFVAKPVQFYVLMRHTSVQLALRQRRSGTDSIGWGRGGGQ